MRSHQIAPCSGTFIILGAGTPVKKEAIEMVRLPVFQPGSNSTQKLETMKQIESTAGNLEVPFNSKGFDRCSILSRLNLATGVCSVCGARELRTFTFFCA